MSVLSICSKSQPDKICDPPNEIHMPSVLYMCVVLTWGICTRRAGKLYRARYRRHRSRSLQLNTHLKALAEIYTIHSFAPHSNLKFLSKKLPLFFFEN